MNTIEEVFTDIYVNRKWDEPNKTNEKNKGKK